MVGEPTTFPKAWFDAFPDAQDATPLLNEARMLKTPQEIERMRLANDIAAAAMEHVQGVIRPGHDRGAGRIRVARLRPRRGHGLGRAGRARARLLARLVGRRDPHVHGDRPTGRSSRASRRCSRSGSAPTATGATTRRTSSPATSPTAIASWRQGLMGVYDEAVAFCVPGASLPELDRSIRDGIDGDRVPRAAVAPDLPRCRRARPRAAVRPPGRRRRDRGGHDSCN